MNIWLLFLTGLTSGGLSCMAMQGGLLASSIANQKDTSPSSNYRWLPVTMFLIAKLITHTIFGFFLGWLGSHIALSIGVRLFFQGLTAAFMLATAANLLELHPIFRYVVFQPPRFLQKLVRTSTKNAALFTPAFLGVLTIFIPCGVTQAVEVLAISSGSPFLGAASMFAFVLGTSPLFALLGIATATLSENFKQNFAKIAAATLIFLSLSSFNGILIVLNSPVTFTTFTKPLTYFFSEERFRPNHTQAPSANGVQKVTIQVQSNGYSPNKIQVKAGIPVQLTLQTKNTYSCASSFILKEFNINLQLGPTDSKTVTFTPVKKGQYTFSCSMGMYSGTLEVL